VLRLLRSLFPFARIGQGDRLPVALAWLTGLLQGFAQAQATTALPFTRVGLGMTEAEMSLLLSATRLASVGALVFSWWGDHRGRRRPFLAAYALLVAATASTAAVEAPWQFGVLQAIVRAATTAVGTLAVVLVAEQVAIGVRVFAIALYGAGGSLGAGLALAVLPLADDSPESWRTPFALAGVGLLALPLLVRHTSESRVFRPGARAPGALGDLLTGPFARRFWLSGAAGLLASSFSAVGIAFSTERLVNDLGFSTGRAVLISLIGGTAGGIGFFAGGRLADVAGRRATTMGALVAVLAGGVGLYRLTDPASLVAAIVVSTFGSFAFIPAAAAHRAELFPTAVRSTAGTTGAWLATLGSAGGLAAANRLIDRLGLSATVTWLGMAMVAAIALTALLPETRGQALETVKADR
jgi:MFS family permease